MHDGTQAVQIFFLISGFYMGLLLDGKQVDLWAFYNSRASRILFPYFVVLALIVAASVLCGSLTGNWLSLWPWVGNPIDHNGWESLSISGIVNFTVVGQDMLLFLSQPVGQPLTLTGNPLSDARPLYNYVIIPQCWSVSLELMFYILVPFILRLRTSVIILLCCISAGLRFSGYSLLGLAHDPWTYRFFPFELGVFFMGILSHRLYLHLKRFKRIGLIQIVCKSRFGYFIFCCLILAFLVFFTKAVGFVGLSIGHNHSRFISYVVWIFLIPVLFAITGRNSFDRIIGELSYPIYLVHLFLVSILVWRGSWIQERHIGPVAAITSIALACLLNQTLFSVFDKWRRRKWHPASTPYQATQTHMNIKL